jgi:hypothetical protein
LSAVRGTKLGPSVSTSRKLRKNHMVQAWVLGLSWMTGPVEQVLPAGVSRLAGLVFNLRV